MFENRSVRRSLALQGYPRDFLVQVVANRVVAVMVQDHRAPAGMQVFGAEGRPFARPAVVFGFDVQADIVEERANILGYAELPSGDAVLHGPWKVADNLRAVAFKQVGAVGAFKKFQIFVGAGAIIVEKRGTTSAVLLAKEIAPSCLFGRM